jgi:hypothetical protein
MISKEGLIKPHEVHIADSDGNEHTFTVSRFPATEGRRLLFQYLETGVRHLDEYQRNEKVMQEAMSFVAIELGGTLTRLSNKALINQYVPDWETLVKLEGELISYNCSFLEGGVLSNITSLIQTVSPLLNTKTSTDSSPVSSLKGKQP